MAINGTIQGLLMVLVGRLMGFDVHRNAGSHFYCNCIEDLHKLSQLNDHKVKLVIFSLLSDQIYT